MSYDSDSSNLVRCYPHAATSSDPDSAFELLNSMSSMYAIKRPKAAHLGDACHPSLSEDAFVRSIAEMSLVIQLAYLLLAYIAEPPGRPQTPAHSSRATGSFFAASFS